MKIAVSCAYWEFCTRSTIFLLKPSNRSSFEEAGWPSTRPLGFTNDTAGRLPPEMSAYRLVESWMCAATRSGWVMMEVSYWNGLQIVQYVSGNCPLAGLFI